MFISPSRKPDFRGVANLDGYLYTCLRNVYLSTLARASREALHLVSVEDYDSFAFAISANSTGESLQRQNDLRRVCSYAVWRKEASKSASYFILHFFHGYGRREIAELAQLPIAAIYNKLKTARGEVRSYLEEPGKLRIVNRDTPPKPTLSWSLLSSQDLFRELRQTILDARNTDCLPEAGIARALPFRYAATYLLRTARPHRELRTLFVFDRPGFTPAHVKRPRTAGCIWIFSGRWW